MRNVKQMKADHEARCNITSEDLYFYKEPPELTDEQKEHLLQVEEDVKRRFAERDRFEKEWMERNYEGTEIRDHYNH